MIEISKGASLAYKYNFFVSNWMMYHRFFILSFFGVNELDSISAWGFGTIIIKLEFKFDGGIGKALRWICIVGRAGKLSSFFSESFQKRELSKALF